MRVLLTGGSGDLGTLVARGLLDRGDAPVIFDPAPPQCEGCDYIEASILDRPALQAAMQDGVDCVVHIAAWHGIHEFQGSKSAWDFHDVNVTGTFNTLQAAAEADLAKFVFISSTSVDDRFGIYGHTKILNEEMMRAYAARHGMDIVTLRPRAFIPPWNRGVYDNFIEWAAWFWKGAVHVDDVKQATILAIDHLKNNGDVVPELPIDGAYEFTQDDLKHWDEHGPGSTFKRVYGEDAHALAVQHGLDPTRPPKILGHADAEKYLGYAPRYSLKNLLEDLRKYGESGPPAPFRRSAA